MAFFIDGFMLNHRVTSQHRAIEFYDRVINANEDSITQKVHEYEITIEGLNTELDKLKEQSNR